MKTRIRKTKVCMKKIYRSGSLRLEILIWLSVVLVLGMLGGIGLVSRDEKVLTVLDYVLLMFTMLIVLAIWIRISKNYKG